MAVRRADWSNGSRFVTITGRCSLTFSVADPDDTGMVAYEAFVERIFKETAAMEKAKAAAKEAAKAGGKK